MNGTLFIDGETKFVGRAYTDADGTSCATLYVGRDLSIYAHRHHEALRGLIAAAQDLLRQMEAQQARAVIVPPSSVAEYFDVLAGMVAK